MAGPSSDGRRLEPTASSTRWPGQEGEVTTKYTKDAKMGEVRITYLKSTGKQLGLPVNFGHYPKIEHERFINQSRSRIARIS